MEKYLIPGIAVAWVKNEEITHLEFGVKDIVTKNPVDASTLFEAASLSKPIVAYAALKLVKEGALDIDKPLASYLLHPYLDNHHPYLAVVTLRHILTHTAGFASANLKVGQQLDLPFYPGSQFGYSGESFRYLAHVIERVTNTSFNTYIQNNLFKPLNMHSSSFIWEEKQAPNYASPHDKQGCSREKWKPQRPVASFSLHTTATDFSKFMKEVFHVKKSNQYSGLPLDINFPINEHLSWCAGWGMEKTPAGNNFWHSGDNGTFQCFCIFLSQKNASLVMMTNSANGLQLCQDVLQQSINEPHPLIEWEFASDESDAGNHEDIFSNWWEIYGV